MATTLRVMCRDLLESCGEVAARLAGWLFRNVLIYFADVATCYAIWEEPRQSGPDVDSSSHDDDGCVPKR